MSGEDAVQGYIFQASTEDPRSGDICKIVRRAEVSDYDATEYGPAFVVVFGDGESQVAYASDLNPWYPV